MGSEDVKRQAPNVYRMKLLGATVVPVESRLEDAEGRAQRGDARLGHQRREHVLHHRHRRRPASVSDDGARLPARDRRASACVQMPEHDRPPARRGDRLRRRRLATRWASSIRTSTHADVRLIGVEAAGEGLETGKHAASLLRRHARRAARQPHLPAAGRRRPDHRDAFDLAPASTIPGVGPEHAWLKDSGRAEYVGITDDEALAAFHDLLPHRRHHPGARIEPRDRPRDEARADDAEATRSCSSTCPAAATRTCTPSPSARASNAAVDVAASQGRIRRTLARERRRKALIPYITAGDPHRRRSPCR